MGAEITSRVSSLTEPDRRGFLLLAGLALGAGSGVLAGCSGGTAAARHSGTASPSATGSQVAAVGPTPATAPSPPQAADWQALGQQLSSGRLVTPGSSAYVSAKQLFDPRFDDAHPAGIAYCATPEDVSACLAFVRRFGLPVTARSGGHSYGGWSTSAGLVIDVSQLNTVSVDPVARTVRVGSGTLLIDFYSALAAHGQAVPGGSCPTVGIAGLALGGGVGVVGRMLGLTCDSLLSVQIVTADGAIRECGQGSEPDLFWACQGGGGGNFGVVTSFTFRTHPAPELCLFYLEWPWSQASAVLSAWQSWAPSARDELWSNLHMITSAGGSEPTISVGGTYAGSTADAQVLLSQLYAAVGSQPRSAFLNSEPYLTVMLVEAGCSSLSVAQCHQPSQDLAGRLGREPEVAKSDFYTAKLPPHGIATLIAQVEAMQRVAGAPGAVGAVAFDACGGAINRVSPGATAFVHRSALFLAQYSTSWVTQGTTAGAGGGAGSAGPGLAAGASTAAVERQRAWLRALHAAMRPYASGEAYQNYTDPELADWQRAYYGSNYPRLQRVKAAVDPANLFRFPQSVELPA